MSLIIHMDADDHDDVWTETEEQRACRTVERDAADVQALGKSLPGVHTLIKSITVTVAQTPLHD